MMGTNVRVDVEVDGITNVCVLDAGDMDVDVDVDVVPNFRVDVDGDTPIGVRNGER